MKKTWNTINQKLDQGDNRIYFNIFIAAMLVMCFPLFNNQLFIGHDWTYHMLRMQSLKEGLLTGQLPVRVNPLFLNGYGYASSLFYPDVLLYIPVGLQLLGIGIEESYKIFLTLVLAASFLTAYYCGKGITKSSYAGIIFALVFSLSQYHLQNIYTRFAVGEVTAYIFLPFVIYGLYNLIFEEFEKPWLLVVGFSGLMLTHTISLGLSGLSAVIITLFAFPSLLKQPKKLLWLFFSILAVLGITCWYWVPIVEQMLSATFGLTHSLPIWIQVRAVKIPVMFANSYILKGSDVAIGLSITLLCLLRIFIDKNPETSRERKIINWSMGFGFLFLFVASDLFPWQLAPSIFNNLSYPWRHYAMASLLLAAAIGMMMEVLFRGDIRMLGLILLVLFMVGSGITVVTNSITTIGDPIDLTAKYYKIAKNTDAISGGEWLPSGVDPKAVSYAKPVVITSDGKLLPFTKDGLKTVIEYDTPRKYVDVPIIYYKGYSAEYEDSSGKSLSLPISDAGTNKTVRVDTDSILGPGTITINYTGTNAQKVSLIASIIITAGILALIFKEKTRKNEKAMNHGE